VKKVNKNRPALRENSPTLLCIFSGQTAPSPRHYTRNAPITKIGNGATTALAATSLVIEDEEVETKKKKKQDLVFDSAAGGGSRSLWKTDQKEQHGGPSLKDRFVSGSCCSPFADATES
jgi:hypothetical protein